MFVECMIINEIIRMECGVIESKRDVVVVDTRKGEANKGNNSLFYS